MDGLEAADRGGGFSLLGTGAGRLEPKLMLYNFLGLGFE
jgi:hypothetical protein